jgi:hypothetical protein
MSLTVRPTNLLSLPLIKNADISHPESLVLRITSQSAVDIGAICYQVRGSMGSAGKQGCVGRSKVERLVNLISIDLSRGAVVRDLIKYLSERLEIKAVRPLTITWLAKHIIRFVDWTDKSGLPFPLRDVFSARNTIEQYVSYLREQVRLGILSNNSAANCQMGLIGFFQDFLPGADSITHGLNLLNFQKYNTKHTEPPSETDQAHVLVLARSLFEGLADLVLHNRPYPYALAIPENLGAKDNLMWVFPSRRWCMPPHQLKNREKMNGYKHWAYDYENGRVADVAEIQDHYVINLAKVRKAAPAESSIRNAKAKIAAANSNSQHGYRRNAAMTAHNAFLILFFAHTGMNMATVQQLEWENKEIAISAERQGFRTIKYRAKGRAVSFEIQPVFLPLFKKFLQIRDFLLNGQNFEFLFLASGNHVKKLTPLNPTTLKSCVEVLQRIDPAMPSIMSKQWRAGKSDWLLRHTDPATAAIVLQNSECTVLKAYAAGSASSHLDEMSSFFFKLEETVLAKGVEIEGGLDSALGVCNSYGQPQAVGPSPTRVDCENLEGCLFCKHFRVHADEVDIRKLVSCRYFLQQTARLVKSEEYFLSVFSPILNRIDVLLTEIERRSDGLVERIKIEVSEGELDPYWSGKFEMLIDLGMI